MIRLRNIEPNKIDVLFPLLNSYLSNDITGLPLEIPPPNPILGGGPHLGGDANLNIPPSRMTLNIRKNEKFEKT